MTATRKTVEHPGKKTKKKEIEANAEKI